MVLKIVTMLQMKLVVIFSHAETVNRLNDLIFAMVLTTVMTATMKQNHFVTKPQRLRVKTARKLYLITKYAMVLLTVLSTGPILTGLATGLTIVLTR